MCRQGSRSFYSFIIYVYMTCFNVNAVCSVVCSMWEEARLNNDNSIHGMFFDEYIECLQDKVVVLSLVRSKFRRGQGYSSAAVS